MHEPGVKYQPSNGTEGMWFTDKFCDNCLNQHPDPNNKKQCMILCRTLVYSPKDEKYPEEWMYDDNGNPICTAFVKWDWGNDGDPDDPDNPKYRPPDLDNPNQLLLPFIFDELEIRNLSAGKIGGNSAPILNPA